MNEKKIETCSNCKNNVAYCACVVHMGLYRQAKKRVEELEKQLAFIGDKAVNDWDDETVGQVDAVVPKAPKTYAEWARDVLDCDRKKKERIKALETLMKEFVDNWETMDPAYADRIVGDMEKLLNENNS
jgi:hypothetical protein